ncbi:membrane protein [Escherichia phage EcS1]|uniref:Uncharacterized protein n=1 Tax=Escherichia phage EcS1 TaxID=2083276 RepID=A0A2Z5ZCF4_9CAUD|nr:membrane protein [Escherichia phage EcS1]BBC78157.1 Hypothetical protein [Escherichia phage EcS1]
MQIKRNSWHYKLNMFYCNNSEWRIPTSLCPYFWKTLFFTCFASFKALIIGFFAWFLGHEIAIWLASYIGIHLGTIGAIVPGVIVGAIMLATTIAVGLGIAFGTHWVYEYIKDYFEERRYRKRRERIESGVPEKEPSLLVSFIKAKKSKYCPSLEFIDVEKSK